MSPDDLANFARKGAAAQSAVDLLAKIYDSGDVAWLRSTAVDADNSITVRKAAERRLKILTSRKKP